MDLSIILPTYNEKENISILIPEIENKMFGKHQGEILIVDDNSPDGTGELALQINKTYGNIRLISRQKKEGIGAALREGYDKANGELIISSDSDLSFEVGDMQRLIDKINEGYDLVVGSRHLSEKDYIKPSFKIWIKGMISRFGNKAVTQLSGIDIHDFSANFRAIKKETWRNIQTKENTNSILLEMIMKSYYKGYKVAEIPIIFGDRKYGKSKMVLMKEAPKFFMKLLRFVWDIRICKRI